MLFKKRKIQEFKKYLESEYGENGKAYFSYAMTNLHFNSNFKNPKLEVKVAYFSSEKEVVITFSSFQFYFVSDESNISYVENNYVEGFAFIFIYNQHQIIESMLNNGYGIEFELRDKNISDFFVVRILTQNYFIDIFTDTLPDIDY